MMPMRRLTMSVQDVDGRGIVDPVAFLRVSSTNSAHQTTAKLELSGGGIDRFVDVPADATLRIRLSPSRYRDGAVFASVNGDGEIAVPTMALPRRPDRWLPAFSPFASLGGSFAGMIRVLRASPRFRLGRDSVPGKLVDSAFDAVSPSDESRSLAKMCLLNLCSRLEAEGMPGKAAWIDRVQELLVCQRDRLIAVVGDDVFQDVEALAKAGDGVYRKSNAALHRKNLERIATVSAVGAMVSVKTRVSRANLQLTVGRVQMAGQAAVLLDADLDEHGELVPHTFDVVRHLLTKGATHPIDIHEGLRRTYPGLRLGYDLEPAVPVGEVTVKVLAANAEPAPPAVAGAATIGHIPESIAVLGDSVPWGQGLLSSQKVHTLVANALSYATPESAPPTTRLLAHSGAVIGVGAPQGPTQCHGEVPTAFRTILQQVSDYPAAEAAGVDLLIVNGGINDVDFRFIVNPLTEPDDLEATTVRACGDDMTVLLDAALAKFPRAKIVVLSYYPILSPLSHLPLVAPFVAALGVELPLASFADPAGTLGVWQRVIRNCGVFYSASTAAMRSAVEHANTGLGIARCFLADPGFRDEHAALAPEARLFGINWDLSPQDPIAGQRRAACEGCEPNPLRRQLCYRASAGHPNAEGAAAFARSVLMCIS